MFAKKNVVAAAALLALAAGAAQAQVKVYGYVEATFGSYERFSATEADNTSRTTEVGSGNMMTSFLGFSGSEDLGGGLKAEFVLETFLAADTGATLGNNGSNFWGRGSWVGLSGDFGRVALGQYDNAFFTMGLLYNPFGSSMTFSPTMVTYYKLTGDAFIPASLGYDTGWVNSITYETPNFGGFTAALQYSPKETSASGDDVKDNLAISAAYNAGPLSLMAVYTTSGANGVTPGLTTATFVDRQKDFGFGVSYDFGSFKLMGQFSQVKSETGGTDTKAKFFQIGATIPVSPAGNVLASYGQTKYDDGFQATPDGSKFTQFSLGYDHSISKRTGAYAAFTSKKLSDFGVDDSTANVFAVGVRHSF